MSKNARGLSFFGEVEKTLELEAIVEIGNDVPAATFFWTASACFGGRMYRMTG
jgi:hypothetical protein